MRKRVLRWIAMLLCMALIAGNGNIVKAAEVLSEASEKTEEESSEEILEDSEEEASEEVSEENEEASVEEPSAPPCKGCFRGGIRGDF